MARDIASVVDSNGYRRFHKGDRGLTRSLWGHGDGAI